MLPGPALTAALHATTLEAAAHCGCGRRWRRRCRRAGGTVADRGGLARAGARRRRGSIADRTFCVVVSRRPAVWGLLVPGA